MALFSAIRRDRSFRRLLVLLLGANLATTGILGVALYLRAEQAARAQVLESNRLILSQLDLSVNAVPSEFDKTFASLILDFTTRRDPAPLLGDVAVLRDRRNRGAQFGV